MGLPWGLHGPHGASMGRGGSAPTDPPGSRKVGCLPAASGAQGPRDPKNPDSEPNTHPESRFWTKHWAKVPILDKKTSKNKKKCEIFRPCEERPPEWGAWVPQGAPSGPKWTQGAPSSPRAPLEIQGGSIRLPLIFPSIIPSWLSRPYAALWCVSVEWWPPGFLGQL